MDDETIRSRVKGQLEEVLDPCSTFTDQPVNIVDLGLIDGIEVNGKRVKVELLPTNQLCMYMMNIQEEVEEQVGKLASVETVHVEQVADKVWTQDRMSEEEYNRRHERFEERAEKHDLTPYYDDDGQPISDAQ